MRRPPALVIEVASQFGNGNEQRHGDTVPRVFKIKNILEDFHEKLPKNNKKMAPSLVVKRDYYWEEIESWMVDFD